MKIPNRTKKIIIISSAALVMAGSAFSLAGCGYNPSNIAAPSSTSSGAASQPASQTGSQTSSQTSSDSTSSAATTVSSLEDTTWVLSSVKYNENGKIITYTADEFVNTMSALNYEGKYAGKWEVKFILGSYISTIGDETVPDLCGGYTYTNGSLSFEKGTTTTVVGNEFILYGRNFSESNKNYELHFKCTDNLTTVSDTSSVASSEASSQS